MFIISELDGIGLIFAILSGITTFVLTFFIIDMANKRNRSAFGWFIAALFVTPYLAGLYLFLIGGKEKEEVTIDEEEISWYCRDSAPAKKKVENSETISEISNEAINETINDTPSNLPNFSGKTINDLYKRD